MQGAYLIRRLAPWYENNGKRLVKSSKLYVRTPAILHHLLQIKNSIQLQTHPAIGASWESYVVEQLHICKPADLQMYYYRTQHGAEIDVVLVRGVTPVASIEIKYSNTPTLSRGVYESIADLGTVKNFVITPGSHSFMLKENIKITSLADFLVDEMSHI